MSGSVSTCRALTAASAQEDTHSKETDDAARVSGVMHTHYTHLLTVTCVVCGMFSQNDNYTL